MTPLEDIPAFGVAMLGEGIEVRPHSAREQRNVLRDDGLKDDVVSITEQRHAV